MTLYPFELWEVLVYRNCRKHDIHFDICRLEQELVCTHTGNHIHLWLTWEVRDHLELCKFGQSWNRVDCISMQSYSEFQRVGQGRSMLLPKPWTMISELLFRPHCFVPQSYNFAHDKYHENWIETELIIDWFIFRWIVNYESIHFWNELNWMNQFIGFQNESWMWINSKNKWMDTGLTSSHNNYATSITPRSK